MSPAQQHWDRALAAVRRASLAKVQIREAVFQRHRDEATITYSRAVDELHAELAALEATGALGDFEDYLKVTRGEGQGDGC